VPEFPLEDVTMMELVMEQFGGEEPNGEFAKFDPEK